MNQDKLERTVQIGLEQGSYIEGDLTIPSGARTIILFSHGSGSSRHSTRNRYVANILNEAGFATLLVDLLTTQEKVIDEKMRHIRYDIELLSNRVIAVTRWLVEKPETSGMTIGYFGTSTGAAAMLVSARKLNGLVKAIVCRGGRPDLADYSGILHHLTTPTLLITGGNDTAVIEFNRNALKQLAIAEGKELVVIPGAGHLFEEPGKMEEVAKIGTEWFECYLLNQGKFKNKYNITNSLRFFSVFKGRQAFNVKFRDRLAAGEILASSLSKYRNLHDLVTVIGIPRGGVIVADAIRRKLCADFDIVVSRKLRSPENSEMALGAIINYDSIYLSAPLDSMSVTQEYLELEITEQKKEVDRRIAKYRPLANEYKIKERIVILVDDGIATGATIVVAARWIRKQQPKKLIIAVPVAPRQIVEWLRNEADSIEIIRSPKKMQSVEQFYKDFSPVPDEDIMRITKHDL